MRNCAPAKIAALWSPCRRSSGNELVPIVQAVPAVQTISEPEYLLQRVQRAQRRNLVSEIGAPCDLAQDMLGARKILFFVNFVLLWLRVFAACANFCRFQIAESIRKYHVTTKAHEGHEGSGNYYISISSFVLPSALLRACFATFVVIMSVSILVAAQPRWVLCGEA